MSSGIRVAQSGFKVKDPDYRQAFSSGWPILNIVESGFGSFLAGEKIVEHNLGYHPAFLLFIDRANNSQEVGSSTFIDGYNDDFFITDQALYHSSTSTLSLANVRYFIFNIDLEKEFKSDSIELGDENTFRNRPSGSGVRFAKRGQTVKARRYIDLTIRDDAIIPLVHSVNPSIKVATTTNVAHDLEYPPKALAYVYDEDLGGYRMGVSSFQSSVVATSKEIQFSLTGFSNAKQSVIILKDPLRLAG